MESNASSDSSVEEEEEEDATSKTASTPQTVFENENMRVNRDDLLVLVWISFRLRV